MPSLPDELTLPTPVTVTSPPPTLTRGCRHRVAVTLPVRLTVTLPALLAPVTTALIPIPPTALTSPDPPTVTEPLVPAALLTLERVDASARRWR